jgi:hypothetical protein
MSDEIRAVEDQLVREWIRPALGTKAVAVFDGAPSAAGDGVRVTLRLLDLLPHPLPRGKKDPPKRLQARYAVTAAMQQGNEGEARAALVELAFAAIGSGFLELEQVAPSLDYFRALGVPPQPALIVHVQVERAAPARAVPRVRVPLDTRWAPLQPLDGVVVTGPEDVAIAGAMIELPGYGLMTYSDDRGAFRFAAVPRDPPTKTLIVEAKGERVAFQTTLGEKQIVLSVPIPES